MAAPWRGISLKKWVKERKQKRKEEARLHKAEVHAAVSVAGVAAVLAAIAAENSAPAARGSESAAMRETAVASAAALVAAQGAKEAAAAGGAAAANAREDGVREYKSDVRNPSAEEFVPLSRRQGDGARRLSADAPVFVSPAIDYYAPHHPFQHQQMHVLQVVGGAGRDSSSDGSASGQPNRRVSPRPIADSGSVFRFVSRGALEWRRLVARSVDQI